MKKRLISSLLHIWVFVIIEIAFIFIILHEFPEIGFFEKLWFIHLIYWIFIFIAWYIRENLKSYKTRFLATYSPVVFHILWHIYIWNITIKTIADNSEHAHNSSFWLTVSTIILWCFILAWEYLIHKKYHCDSHHKKVHKHCKEEIL